MGWNGGRGTHINIANVRNSQTDTHDGVPSAIRTAPIARVCLELWQVGFKPEMVRHRPVFAV